MRIIFYSPHPHLGLFDKAGYATHMQMIIKALREQGHEVKVIVAGGVEKTLSDNLSSPIEKKGRIKKLIPSLIWETLKDINLLWFDQKIKKKLIDEIRVFKPDLIYERINYFQTSGVKAANKFSVFHIAEINSPYVEERVVLQGKSLLLFLARIKEKYILKKTTKAFVVSSSLKKYFIDRGSVSPYKIEVVPNAIDLDLVGRDLDPISREIQNRIEGKTVIGFVGSIAPWHGIERLLLAIEFLNKQRKDLVFLIVGGGQNLNEFKKMAIDKGIENVIVWTGSIPNEQVFPLIKVMDITVMPDSNWYGSPIKIFEYGMFKKPIIAPDYGPLRDVIENEKDGLLIGKSESDLENAIIRLLDNKNLAKDLGISFYHKIISKFTWKEVADKISKEVNSK